METIANIEDQRELLAAIRNGELPSERTTAYWTAEERAELEVSYRKGVGISELSLRLQRSETAICQQVIAMGLTVTSGSRGPRKTKPSKCSCPRCLETKCSNYDEKGGLCLA